MVKNAHNLCTHFIFGKFYGSYQHLAQVQVFLHGLQRFKEAYVVNTETDTNLRNRRYKDCLTQFYFQQ